jgi:hypothetical protein
MITIQYTLLVKACVCHTLDFWLRVDTSVFIMQLSHAVIGCYVRVHSTVLEYLKKRCSVRHFLNVWFVRFTTGTTTCTVVQLLQY